MKFAKEHLISYVFLLYSYFVNTSLSYQCIYLNTKIKFIKGLSQQAEDVMPMLS